MPTLTYSRDAVDSNVVACLPDFYHGTDSALPYAGPRRLPAAVSAGQAYYWSFIWQRDQQESQNALEQGQGVTFDSAQEAIRWLLSSDE